MKICYGAGKLQGQVTQTTDKNGKKVTSSKPLPKQDEKKGK